MSQRDIEKGRQWSTPPLTVSQEVLNRSGKARPGTPFDGPRPVEARVQWEADGWATITGFAERWDAQGVYVVFDDPRNAFTGAWLALEHVTPVDG